MRKAGFRSPRKSRGISLKSKNSKCLGKNSKSLCQSPYQATINSVCWCWAKLFHLKYQHLQDKQYSSKNRIRPSTESLSKIFKREKGHSHHVSTGLRGINTNYCSIMGLESQVACTALPGKSQILPANPKRSATAPLLHVKIK